MGSGSSKRRRGQLPVQPVPERERDGLFPLTSAEEYEIDIVAVHGLQGHWRHTWTAENGRFWLQDFLPVQFPTARVMSFGYDSDVAFTRSDTDITDVAKMLLERLHAARRDDGKKRPIVFISHSLGGIIVKKALIDAQLASERYSDLLHSLCGLVFFGVPHRGSDAAYWARFASRLSRFLLFGRTNRKFVAALVRNSETLAGISQQFIQQGASVKIRTFYETRMISNQLIVDKDSACLGVGTEVAVGVASADHRDMCKFEDVNSQKYSPVKDAIGELVECGIQPKTVERTSKMEECLRSLSFDGIGASRLADDLENSDATFGAVKRDEEFEGWRNGLQSDVLWVVGKPGCGKSTLSRHLFKVLRERAPKSTQIIIGGYFNNAQGGDLERSEEGLLQTLLFQILTESPALFRQTLQVYIDQEKSQKKGEFRWTRDALREMLKKAVAGTSTRRIFYFILDAFDENSGSPTSKDSLLKFITSLGDTEDSTVKILVTSRPYPGLQRHREGRRTIYLDRLTSDDIALYVRAELKHIAKVFEEELENEILQLEEVMIERANGVFLWVRLVAEHLRSVADKGEDFPVIRNTVNTTPEGLTNLYDLILKRTEESDRPKQKQLLEWVALSPRGLTLEELRYALALGKPGRFSSQESLPLSATAAVGRSVSALSGGLLEVTTKTGGGEDIVQFIHLSARDYLLGEQSLNAQSAFGIRSVKEGHANLAKSCVTYLTLSDFDRYHDLPTHEIDSSRTAKLNTTYPFLDYAAHNWTTHASLAGDEGDCVSTMMEAFKWPEAKYLTAWLQVYLYGSLNKAHDITSLHIAAMVNAPKFVREFLKGKVDINQRCRAYGTALQIAAKFNHRGIVELLLSNGAAVTVADTEWGNALEPAAFEGHIDVVNLLLERGVDANIKTGKYGGALQAAANAGHVEPILLLIEKGAEVNGQGVRGRTALHAAAYEGHYEAVQALADNKANLDAMDDSRSTPLLDAICGHPWNRRPRVFGADTENWAKTVGVLLKNGANPSLTRPNFYSPLNLASSFGLVDIASLLLEKGVDSNQLGSSTRPPLFFAADSWNVELVRLLLSKGANPNTIDDHTTPLHLAADGHGSGGWTYVAWVEDTTGVAAKVIKLLLDYGASPNVLDDRGRTPLHWAADSGLAKAVEVLLAHGADPTMRDSNGDLPLHRGARYPKVVAAFLDSGKDVGINAKSTNASEQNGATPLGLAAFNGNEAGIQKLLEHQAEIEAADSDGDTSLAQAAWNGQAGAVEVLLKARAKIDTKGASGNTPLHHAASNGHNEVVKLLLRYGANPSAVNASGDKPLHLAARGSFYSTVRLLDQEMELNVDNEDAVVGDVVRAARQRSGSSSEGEPARRKLESFTYKKRVGH